MPTTTTLIKRREEEHQSRSNRNKIALMRATQLKIESRKSSVNKLRSQPYTHINTLSYTLRIQIRRQVIKMHGDGGSFIIIKSNAIKHTSI